MPTAAALLGVLATGCDLLPSDGPNANGMLAHASTRVSSDEKSNTVTRFALVSISARIADDVENYYQVPQTPPPAQLANGGSFGNIGVGDVLRVTIWESGEIGLFSGRERKGTDITVRVDPDGTVALPYAGRFAVAGRRVAEVEAAIVARLSGQAAAPQATVIVSENLSSTVSVQGEVIKPGLYPIARAGQRVLDMTAMAGGSRYPPHETLVRLTRGSTTMVAPLQEVIDRPAKLNVLVSAGDTLLVLRNQKKFLAFGAVARPGEQIFSKQTLNLSEGLGQAMGLDPARSDAKGVFLFRREPVALAERYGLAHFTDGRTTVPIAYQLDLKDPKSFFAMSTFPILPNDILYVSAAPLAEAARFFQILSGATNSVAIPRTLLGNYPTGN